MRLCRYLNWNSRKKRKKPKKGASAMAIIPGQTLPTEHFTLQTEHCPIDPQISQICPDFKPTTDYRLLTTVVSPATDNCSSTRMDTDSQLNTSH